MLEVKNIKIKKDDDTLVSDLSFLADDGRMLCLAGVSNAAASTILRAAIGLERIRSGFVSIEGELLTPSSATEFRKGMAYLPENPEMPCRTMEESANMMFGLQANMARHLTLDCIKEQMRQLGLPEELLKRPKEQLTRQEMRMMMLALVCLPGKKMILVDNPTEGLDQEAAHTVAQYLRSKADEGAAVVVATNDNTITQISEQTITLS